MLENLSQNVFRLGELVLLKSNYDPLTFVRAIKSQTGFSNIFSQFENPVISELSDYNLLSFIVSV